MISDLLLDRKKYGDFSVLTTAKSNLNHVSFVRLT